LKDVLEHLLANVRGLEEELEVSVLLEPMVLVLHQVRLVLPYVNQYAGRDVPQVRIAGEQINNVVTINVWILFQ
jgi:hypothetical protein